MHFHSSSIWGQFYSDKPVTVNKCDDPDLKIDSLLVNSGLISENFEVLVLISAFKGSSSWLFVSSRFWENFLHKNCRSR